MLDTDADQDGITLRYDACPYTEEGASVDATGCSDKNIIGTVYFETDSSSLNKEALAALGKVVAKFTEGENQHLGAKGYADPRGNVEYNQNLSFRRAKNTVAYLKEQGISANSLSIAAMGEENTSSRLSENRRVDIYASQYKADDQPRNAGTMACDNQLDSDDDGDGIPLRLDACPHTPVEKKVDVTGCPVREVLGSIYFETNSSAISTEASITLDTVKTAADADSGKSLIIKGYADSRGPSEFNKRLSSQRSSAARNYLINSGIAEDRLRVDAIGAVDNNKALKENRRVDFFLE
ncbi:MAG: OmpA family protein [Oleibacter sp.]|nr:OmpA family protein [Thalassolituus sp.]